MKPPLTKYTRRNGYNRRFHLPFEINYIQMKPTRTTIYPENLITDRVHTPEEITYKRMNRILVLCLFILGLTWQSQAQTPAQSQADAISRYFSQYADDDKFTSVYISNRMFNLFSKAVEDDKEDREIKQAISKLKGIRILSSDKLADGKKMYQEAARSLPLKGYEELMVVKREGHHELKFLIIEAGGKISELLMLSGGGKDFFMLSMIGDIDLKQISKLSKSMDVKGLEDLEKLDDKKK